MNLNILLIALVLFSCNQNKQNQNSVIVKESLNLKKYQNFEEYWTEFGAAIETGDTNKIKLLVEGPLRILGREYQDPELKLNNNEIVKYVLYIVNNGGYYDFEKDVSISNRTLLRSDLKSISQYDKYSENQYINDFVFKKTLKGWKLVIIYMDTKDLKNQLR
jgi:hypothetical protein